MRSPTYASDTLVVVEGSVTSSAMRRTSSLLTVNLPQKGCRCEFELALDATTPRCFGLCWTSCSALIVDSPSTVVSPTTKVISATIYCFTRIF